VVARNLTFNREHDGPVVVTEPTDPPTPVEDFSGSLYIGKGFNLQADWQNNDHFRAT
jgi:hypothetical protein